MGIRIRPAEVADAAGVRAVADASWRRTYDGVLRRATIDGFLASAYELGNLERRIEGHVFLVADDDGTILGFLDAVTEPDRAFLAAVHVDPARVGGGIGTALLAALLAVAPGLPVDAHVLRGNTAAEMFYARRGFAPVDALTDDLLGEVVHERRWWRPATPGSGAPTPRHAARIVVTDERDRLLLIQFQDPQTGHRWWSAPGGALEPGESYEEAAVRELAEETGLTSAILGPCVWRRQHLGRFNGNSFHAVERAYLVRVPEFEPDSDGWTPLEQQVHVGMRWWTLEELDASTEELSPRRLPELIRQLLANGPPAEPIDAGV